MPGRKLEVKDVRFDHRRGTKVIAVPAWAYERVPESDAYRMTLNSMRIITDEVQSRLMATAGGRDRGGLAGAVQEDETAALSPDREGPEDVHRLRTSLLRPGYHDLHREVCGEASEGNPGPEHQVPSRGARGPGLRLVRGVVPAPPQGCRVLLGAVPGGEPSALWGRLTVPGVAIGRGGRWIGRGRAAGPWRGVLRTTASAMSADAARLRWAASGAGRTDRWRIQSRTSGRRRPKPAG